MRRKGQCAKALPFCCALTIFAPAAVLEAPAALSAVLQEENLKRKQKSKRRSFCFLLLELMQPVPLIVEVSIGAAVLHGVKLIALGGFKHRA